jgi:tight adherence protein C
MFLLSLILLAPIYMTGLYLLFRDDKYFLSKLLKKRISEESANKGKHGRLIAIAISALLIVGALIKSGANTIAVILPVASIGIYIYWELNGDERSQKRRNLQAEAEFPAMVELIAVLIAAGEPPILAMQRVGERSSGVLAEEFLKVITKVESGVGLTKSLENLATTTSSDSIRRFADTLILALERGTSLSDVLSRQVQEVRNEHQTSLIEAAGRAEIALMIPVIFLILPISILFALWPSYLALGRTTFG